jgi:hypothetical protein
MCITPEDWLNEYVFESIVKYNPRKEQEEI